MCAFLVWLCCCLFDKEAGQIRQGNNEMNGEMAATFTSDPREQLLSEVDNGAGGHTGIIVRQGRFGHEYGDLQSAFV